MYVIVVCYVLHVCLSDANKGYLLTQILNLKHCKT